METVQEYINYGIDLGLQYPKLMMLGILRVIGLLIFAYMKYIQKDPLELYY